MLSSLIHLHAFWNFPLWILRPNEFSFKSHSNFIDFQFCIKVYIKFFFFVTGEFHTSSNDLLESVQVSIFIPLSIWIKLVYDSICTFFSLTQHIQLLIFISLSDIECTVSSQHMTKQYPFDLFLLNYHISQLYKISLTWIVKKKSLKYKN